MGPTIPTPADSSTVTTSSASHQPPPFRLLEITVISAQDLSPVSKSMRPYAITWVHPNRKLTTRVDQQGHTNPTWNDKFVFRVEDEFLFAEDTAVNVEIYTVSWFRDVLIGTVRVLISNLITTQQFHSPGHVRYVALQVRRSSGSPQGILNMGVSLVDSTMKSMPLYTDQTRPQALDNREGSEKKVNKNLKEDEKEELHEKINLWRSLSLGTDMTIEESLTKPGSICNGSIINGSVCNNSIVNGSELCSDIGPSASIVAAEMAQKSCPQVAMAPPKALRPPAHAGEAESSILEDFTAEEAAAKGLTRNVSRWRKEAPTKREEGGSSTRGHTRRNSDGGLFSCYAYGFQFTIACGTSKTPKPGSSKSKKKRPSEANST